MLVYILKVIMRPLSKRRQKIFLTSARLSIEPKGAATRTAPFLCLVEEAMGVACGSEALWEPRALSVTADPLLRLVGREEWMKLGLLTSPL